MALTDLEVRHAKPGDSDRKLADERGLYVLITRTGSKLWRFKYRIAGKEKKLSFGVYPDVTLEGARSRRDEARKLISEGIDPSHQRRREKLQAVKDADATFAKVAEEFITKMRLEGKAETTIDKAEWLAAKLNKGIGRRPIAEIEVPELLDVLYKAQAEGKLETAARLRSFAGRVFRFGIATYRCKRDLAADVAGALTAPTVKGHAALIDPTAVGALLRAIDGYQGSFTTLIALQITANAFQRPGEIRKMEWCEIDFDAAVWAIPAGRMKARKVHHVPLSRQVVGLLRRIAEVTGDGKYVFPSIRTPLRPMSENTVNAALRRLGYSNEEQTAHGFRKTASSLLNESGKWSVDAIERALAHQDTNKIRGIYNLSPYWNERVEMAQWWSDYLDQLRVGADIVKFPVKSA